MFVQIAYEKIPKRPSSMAILFNPLTASCENAASLSVPGVLAPCEKFHSLVN
jgi:hypothetical protein